MIRHARCLAAVASAFFAVVLGPVPSGAQNYARTDDLRTRPPELWFPWKEYGLDLRAGGSYLQGNVRSNSFSGGIEFTEKLARSQQVFVEGAQDYAKFNDNIVLDKTRGSLLYAYAPKPHWNLFALSTQARNRFLQIHYRTMNGGGVCYHSFLSGFEHILASLADAGLRGLQFRSDPPGGPFAGPLQLRLPGLAFRHGRRRFHLYARFL